jgi:alkylation response protein AidB-like acyl-CoA dehydrogenase
MPSYTAPLRDYRFCLYELFNFDEHVKLPGFSEFTEDVVTPVLEQAGKFAEQVMFPLNRSGDEEGCKLDNGAVTTPTGFKQAYRALCDGGWTALTCDAQDGGQGMPHMVNFLFEEMMGSANLSFGLYPGLTRGAYVTIAKHGSAEQRALYAPRLASGEWTGSMCLTEAHCGTDLGLLKTTAAPRADGGYSIAGTKIFISAGEHDLTPNIIYLVLARLPDAPKGSKGISLFLVPKMFSDGDGNLGARNTVSCGALEQKMGIHGCSTCVMNFDGATGWLVGEAHQGLKAMFSMMNTERIAVGIQGLAVAEASYQNAVAYARERLQGRAPKGPAEPAKPADPIIVHPDVRRMLMTQKALIEGCRALALWTAQWLDVSERHPSADVRRLADSQVALLTPVVKAFLTDTGSDVANLGMQILGGHGYIRANGQEQLVRDGRIAQIYEGTNGVQAMDFVGRKILQDGGRMLAQFTNPIEAHVLAGKLDPALAEFTAPVEQALRRLQEATSFLLRRAPENPQEVGAAANDYLRLFALTALGYLWSLAAETSLPKSNDEFYRAKLATARFYMQRILPQTAGLHTVIMAGAAPVMELDEASF